MGFYQRLISETCKVSDPAMIAAIEDGMRARHGGVLSEISLTTFTRSAKLAHRDAIKVMS